MHHRGVFAFVPFLILTSGGVNSATAQTQCADPIEPAGVSASDALVMLRAAVGLEECSLCFCDPDGSGAIAATDSLLALKAAVGQEVTLACPFCCEHCACTPDTLTLTLTSVQPCVDCIPRVPPSFSVPDGVKITWPQPLDGEYQLAPAGPCTWESPVPAVIGEKVVYGAGDTECSGAISYTSDLVLVLRVVRTADGWELYAGDYVSAYGWGDMVRATIVSAGCDVGGTAANENEVCALAGLDVPDAYDTHAVAGDATVEPTDAAPACY